MLKLSKQDIKTIETAILNNIFNIADLQFTDDSTVSGNKSGKEVKKMVIRVVLKKSHKNEFVRLQLAEARILVYLRKFAPNVVDKFTIKYDFE